MPDTPPTIPPALTREEWAAQRYDSGWGLRAYLHDAGDLVEVVVEDGDDICHADSTAELHAVAALANHALPDTDPRKITRARVDALRRCMELARDADHAAGRGIDWHRDTFADSAILALDSLLPPE